MLRTFLPFSARTLFAPIIVLTLLTRRTPAADPPADSDDYFEIHIRPILTANCIQCHGETKQEGGLRLTKATELLRGGESGPAIVLGQPGSSLLIEAIRYESFEMPPSGQLPAQAITALETWIEAGAHWPDGTVLQPPSVITAEDRNWWSYQPLQDVSVPRVRSAEWCRNEIDAFILHRLEAEGIHPAPEAEPARLTRRLHYSLTGLPPGAIPVTETAASVAPSSPITDAHTQTIDRLLNSEAYGENQARFWLDLVRYADSDGYRADHERPHAKQYRDYVIRAFNKDMPYDEFIQEQLAGDERNPSNRNSLIATMYLRHWIYEHNQRDVETQWNEILSDITETTADVFLATGLKCARCHDHKFDPLLQRDYYRMKAFFAPLLPREDMPVATAAERAAWQKQQDLWAEATADIRRELHEIENPVLLKHATREGFDKFVPEIKTMVIKHPHEREPYEHQIASMAERQFDVHPEKLPEWLPEQTEVRRQELRKQLQSFDHLKPAPLPTQPFVAADVGPVAPPTRIPDAEDNSPVAPGYPTLLDPADAEIPQLPPALRTTGRRSALAAWIASPENPLTARVIVNRVWQQHFGKGLVETTSDFGQLGTPPSHPELLDWLARRFIADGWSLKKLHRLILDSATYRQSAHRAPNQRITASDPNNTLLWRMNTRRLTGEELRDTLLYSSGELGKEGRSIYVPVRRNTRDPLIGLFDFPDRIRSAGRRHRTTSPTQALMLMNSDWSRARATAMARSFADLPPESFVETVWSKLYFRSPSTEELLASRNFLKEFAGTIPEESSSVTQNPFGDAGTALDLNPQSPQQITVDGSGNLQHNEFQIEAVFLLRSLYADATVRTIATNWTGNKAHAGWSLGVTSEKSGYKPRNLILQLIGKNAEGKMHYEVVASNLRPALNRPYHVSVTVQLDNPSSDGVRFTLRDLSSVENQPMHATAPHSVLSGLAIDRPLQLGGRGTGHLWDGLIRRLRYTAPADTNNNFDIAFSNEATFGRDQSGNARHAAVNSTAGFPKTREDYARIALLHACLNSNELIYLD